MVGARAGDDSQIVTDLSLIVPLFCLVWAWPDSLQRVWEITCNLLVTMTAINGGPWAELDGKNWPYKGKQLKGNRSNNNDIMQVVAHLKET